MAMFNSYVSHYQRVICFLTQAPQAQDPLLVTLRPGQ